MSVAKNIKRIRQEKGLTQKELGEKIGISQEAISLMEIGARKPKVDTAKKIADALNVSVMDIIELCDEKRINNKETEVLESEEEAVEEVMVKITQDRFEKLLDTETRVAVLLDAIRHEGYISIKDIFRILGCSQDVKRIEEELEAQREKLFGTEGEEHTNETL